MRILIIYVGTALLAGYAWKDWYAGVAGLIAMMAILDHPDMPRELLGIQGLNLWNFVLLVAIPAWLVGRHREGLKWDLPPLAGILFAIYLAVVLVGFARLAIDPGPVSLGAGELYGEYLLNPLKFLLPAVMVYDGARSRGRLVVTIGSILIVYVFLALLVIKWVPLSDAVNGADLASRSFRRLDQETGYWRTDLSVMLAGASWAILAARAVVRPRLASLALVGVAAAVFLAQALTAGRGGYLAWITVGLVLCLSRWRLYLVVAPVALVGLLAAAPGVRDRALEGFAGNETAQPGEVDTETLSAGRLNVWPYMLRQVGQAPLVGYGRLGYDRSGLRAFIHDEIDETFGYPHNAYIEWLLDNGWLGMIPLAALYAGILALSLILFVDSTHPYFQAAGGVAFALVGAWAVGATTGRHFYPGEPNVCVWAATGLMLRVWVERSRLSDP